MFCPACGVKNESGLIKCFICGKGLPSLEPIDATPRIVRPPRPAVQLFGSIGDRFLALLFDRVLLAALLTIPAALLAPRLQTNLPSLLWIRVTAATVAIVLVFLYHTLFESAFGSTLGKVIFGLHVRNESESGRLTAVTIRNALRLVDSVGLYAIGFVITLFSKRKQRLGDHMAGTVVVEEPLHWAGRAGFIALWLAAIAGSLFLAQYLCPTCVAIRPLSWPAW